MLPDNFGSRLVGHSIVGGITGGISAELYGGDFWKGFGQGAWTAAYGLTFNLWGKLLVAGVVLGVHKIVSPMFEIQAVDSELEWMQSMLKDKIIKYADAGDLEKEFEARDMYQAVGRQRANLNFEAGVGVVLNSYRVYSQNASRGLKVRK